MATILVAEANANLRHLYRLELEDEGHTVVACANGEECLAALETETIDLAVLAVRLPIRDGFQVLEHIKDQYPRIPVILQSALIEFRDDPRGIPADLFLDKGADLEPLLNGIHDLLLEHPVPARYA
jgi:CheY-like chemotaxis protein